MALVHRLSDLWGMRGDRTGALSIRPSNPIITTAQPILMMSKPTYFLNSKIEKVSFLINVLFRKINVRSFLMILLKFANLTRYKYVKVQHLDKLTNFNRLIKNERKLIVRNKKIIKNDTFSILELN